jgi:lysophospholipase L1-like esterase
MRVLNCRLRRGAMTAVLCVAALAVALAGAAAASARAVMPAVTPGSGYLALGDSVTFGYEEASVVPAPDFHIASSFASYPAMLGAELHLKVANASCPGETAASLIDASAQSNGCENAPSSSAVSYRTSFPLHVHYTGSQLAYAVKYLKGHPGVRLVSLMIGANDLFLCQETTTDQCGAAAEQQATLVKVKANVRTILSAIRHRAHYAGQIAIVNYYSLNYSVAAINGFSQELNAAQDSAARPFTVEVTDTYNLFRQASVHSGLNTCTAGLLTQLPVGGPCGVHPSVAGQALLAQGLADAIHIGATLVTVPTG